MQVQMFGNGDRKKLVTVLATCYKHPEGPWSKNSLRHNLDPRDKGTLPLGLKKPGSKC